MVAIRVELAAKETASARNGTEAARANSAPPAGGPAKFWLTVWAP
jgi:hypothetical protein